MHWTPVPPRILQALKSSAPVETILHMPHAAAGAPCSLLSPACHYILLRLWVCPSLQLLVSAWSKRTTSTQEARGKESILWLLSGWVRSWNGLCLYFSSLPLSRLPDVLGSATEQRRKESRLLEFIHTAHRAALASLPVCKEVSVPLTTRDRKRQTRGREGREGRETGRGKDYVKIRLFPA